MTRDTTDVRSDEGGAGHGEQPSRPAASSADARPFQEAVKSFRKRASSSLAIGKPTIPRHEFVRLDPEVERHFRERVGELAESAPSLDERRAGRGSVQTPGHGAIQEHVRRDPENQDLTRSRRQLALFALAIAILWTLVYIGPSLT